MELSDKEIHDRDIEWLTQSDGIYRGASYMHNVVLILFVCSVYSAGCRGDSGVDGCGL